MRSVLAAVALACLAVPPGARALDGLPGSTWGTLHLDLPGPGRADLILEGWARQGVGLAGWDAAGSRLRLQAYLTLRYRWDSEGLEWNNFLGPGVGLALDLTAPGGAQVTAGVEYVHQWHFRSGDRRPYLAPFLGWYHGWELGGPPWLGSTWGDLRWELPNSGPGNLVLQAWLRQVVVVARWPGDGQTMLLDPYLRLRLGADSRGLGWNNYLGPGLGVALDLERPRSPLLSIGVEYGWEKRLRAAGAVHQVTLFARWYAWWDLHGR